MKFVHLVSAVRKRWAIAVFVNALAALGAMAFPEGAYADGSVTGTISSIYTNVQLGNWVLIGVNGTKTSNPACSNPSQFAFNMSGPNAAQIFSMLLAARVAQTPLTLTGSGACTIYPPVEDLIVVSY